MTLSPSSHGQDISAGKLVRGVMKLLMGHVVATLIHVARVVSTANVVGSCDYVEVQSGVSF